MVRTTLSGNLCYCSRNGVVPCSIQRLCRCKNVAADELVGLLATRQLHGGNTAEGGASTARHTLDQGTSVLNESREEQRHWQMRNTSTSGCVPHLPRCRTGGRNPDSTAPVCWGRVNRVGHHKGSSILGEAAEAGVGREPSKHAIGINGGLEGAPALGGPVPKAELWRQPAEVVGGLIHSPVLHETQTMLKTLFAGKLVDPRT